MSRYLLTLGSVAFTVTISIVVNRLTQGAVEPVVFISCSALWWGCRAYYEASEVNSAHTKKSGN